MVSIDLHKFFRGIRIVFTFYSSYFIAGLIISLACASIVLSTGLTAMSGVLLIKTVSLVIIYFFISAYKHQEFYYYQNLGFSKKRIWVFSIIADLILFIMLMIIISFIR